MVGQDMYDIEYYLIAASKAGQMGFTATQAAWQQLAKSAMRPVAFDADAMASRPAARAVSDAARSMASAA